MKIEIEIDIEAIVREEIRAYIQENLVIKNVVANQGISAKPQEAAEEAQDPEETSDKEEAPKKATRYEYAPRVGRRRSKLEMALHDKEIELERTLTPEEKGQVEAEFEMAEEKTAKAKQKTKDLARAQEMIDSVSEDSEEEESEETSEDESESEESDESASDAAEDDSHAQASDSEESTSPGDALFSSSSDTSKDSTDTESEDEEKVEVENSAIPKAEKLDTIDSLFD